MVQRNNNATNLAARNRVRRIIVIIRRQQIFVIFVRTFVSMCGRRTSVVTIIMSMIVITIELTFVFIFVII